MKIAEETLDRLGYKLKLLASSRPIEVFRSIMQRIGLKHVNMLVYERQMDVPVPVIETKVPIEIKIVSVDEVNNGYYQGVRLASGDDPLQHREALRRLNNGDVCLVAVVDNRVAGFAWLYFQRTKYDATIEREERFGNNEALLYDRFTLPEFRNLGIGAKLNEERLRALSSRGLSKAKLYVTADNVPAIKSDEILGFYPVKVITCLRIFFFKRVTEHPVKSSKVGPIK